MILLFLLLAFAGLGRAGFASDAVDCHHTLCIIFVDCYGAVDGYRDDIIETVLRHPDEHNNFCHPYTIQLLVEFEIRSAHRFDFRVFYNQTAASSKVALSLTGLVDITTAGVIRRKGDIYTEMPISTGGLYDGGGFLSGLYSYRFTLNGGIDENLFVALRAASFRATYRSGVTLKTTPPVIWQHHPLAQIAEDKPIDVCDPSDIVDHCFSAATGEACGKLNISSSRIENADDCKLWYSNSSETWLRVREVACSNGFWTIRHTDSWPVTSAVVWCAERGDKSDPSVDTSDKSDKSSAPPSPSALKSGGAKPAAKSGPPVCESVKTTNFALTIVFAVYCALALILVIVLFILLFRRMGKLSGPSKFHVRRPKGTRDRKSKSKSASKGSASGSSSSEGTQKDKTGKDATPALALNRTVSFKKGKGPSKKESKKATK